MYESFFGFSGDPFRLTPDHRFCWPHRSFLKAQAYLSYGVQRGEGFVLITGRAGTGKTTLVSDLIATAEPDVRVVRITCSPMEDAELVHTLAQAVGLDIAGLDRPTLLRGLIQAFDENHRAGVRPILVIDEAQALSEGALEELRFLTNLEHDGQPLLQIFLLGQEWLADVLERPGLEQLHQRLIAASHLEALDDDEVRRYIEHRLHCVDWDGDPVLDDALFPAICRLSAGIPRRVNHLAGRLLMVGYIEDKHHLGVDELATVVEDLTQERLLPCDESEAREVINELSVGKSTHHVYPTAPLGAEPAGRLPSAALSLESDESILDSDAAAREAGFYGVMRRWPWLAAVGAAASLLLIAGATMIW